MLKTQGLKQPTLTIFAEIKPIDYGAEDLRLVRRADFYDVTHMDGVHAVRPFAKLDTTITNVSYLRQSSESNQSINSMSKGLCFQRPFGISDGVFTTVRRRPN